MEETERTIGSLAGKCHWHTGKDLMFSSIPLPQTME